MKTFLPLAIFALYVTISHGAITNQSSVVNSSQLNSFISTVYKGVNLVDYNWTTVNWSSVTFGAGSTNTTSYVYGLVVNSHSRNPYFPFISTIYKRTLNNTAIALGNQIAEAAVIGTDVVITPSGNGIPASSYNIATGLSCAAILSLGWNGTHYQVYVNIVSGNSTIQTQIGNPVSGQGQLQTHVSLGNIWYDWSSDAFFYTYIISTPNFQLENCTPSAYVGGIYANGTPYWSSPLTIVSNKTGTQISEIIGGGDNFANTSQIYATYREANFQGLKVYYSKTVKSPTTTSAGTPSLLSAGKDPYGAGRPIGVWASDYTYGISLCSQAQYAGNNYSCPIVHYLNGSYSNGSVDSGFSCNYNVFNGPLAVVGWSLSTGYTLIYKCTSGNPGATTYTMGTFYANGTVYSSLITLGSILGPVSFYQDVNRATWVGWTDYKNDTLTSYNGYLAKLQGQINLPPTPPTPDRNLTWVWILFGIAGLMLVIAMIVWVITNKRKKREALNFSDKNEPSVALIEKI